MRIKHHYFMERTKRLKNFLERNNVTYEMCPSIQPDMSFYVFDLYEDQEIYRKFRILFPFTFSFSSIEYSVEEIEEAEWLTVRSVNTKIKREPDQDTFQFSCPRRNGGYRHMEQVGPFSVEKTNKIKWKTKQFFGGTDATGENYLFCAEKTKGLISGLWTGLDFWPVKKYGTGQDVEDVYQLHFNQVLALEAFALTGKEKINTCRICGRKKIHINTTYQLSLKKAYMKEKEFQNVYTTGNIWTYERIGWYTFSFNIVSHEFYRFCKDRKIDRGLKYEPIKLV